MRSLATWLIAALSAIGTAQAGPRKIQGVNIGGWLIFEPWMAPTTWHNMGGESCHDCTQCVSSEMTLVQKIGQERANELFKEHWESWFTQDDVDELVCLGLNTVRIPIGWWAIEEIKNWDEPFATGQLAQLKRGLKMLKEAGIWVMLDLHANPGSQAVQQQFTGHCVAEAGFYVHDNYYRSLQASAILAALIHADPDFSMVFALQAVNEPESNPEDTPGLLQYYKDFVKTVRGVEQWMGMRCPTTEDTGTLSQTLNADFKGFIRLYLAKYNLEPELFDQVTSRTDNIELQGSNDCIQNTFMSSSWQHVNAQANKPSESAMGVNLYDHHLYLSFGGVTDDNPHAYLSHMCGLQRFREAAWWYGEAQALAFLGEWWLAAQWTGQGEPDLDFYRQFGDAQKMMYYGQSKGWIFWSWKVENTDEFGYTRDYRQAVQKGIMTQDPDAYFNPNVCQPYWDEFSRNGKRSDIPYFDLEDRDTFAMQGLPQMGGQGMMPMAGDTLLKWD